jgi:hydroxypyruvate isomerase
MNRRDFARSCAGALLGTSAPNSGFAINRKQPASDPPHIPFPLSVMLWTVFRDLPFDSRLEKVSAAGYQNVELVGEYEKWTDEDFSRVIAKRKQLGIRFDCTAGLKNSLSNPAERDAFLAELRQTLPLMEKLECSAIILLSGDLVPGMSIEQQQQSCVEGLKAAAKVIDGKKIAGEPVRLLLENIDPEENPKYFLTSSARGFEIVKSVQHPQVQFCYDLFHEQIAEGNLIEKLQLNIEHVGLVHVADVPGRHAPGTGEINYRNIIRKLADLKYKHVVAMEFLPLGNPIAELRAAQKYFTDAVTL